jgi:hypothetical protein
MAVNELVLRWEQMRNAVERQLEVLRSGQIETHDGAQNTTAETIVRLRELRGKLDLLLLTNCRYESREGDIPDEKDRRRRSAGAILWDVEKSIKHSKASLLPHHVTTA